MTITLMFIVYSRMEDYYTVQTPDHHGTLFSELHVLQKQGVLCDVILAAEDGEVMAHKVTYGGGASPKLNVFVNVIWDRILSEV